MAATPLTVQQHLRFFSVAVVVAFIVCFICFQWNGVWLTNAAHRIIPNDFLNVWTAGSLANDGNPEQAYQWKPHRAVQVAVLGREFDGYYAWLYPPTWLFAASLLALLPYLMAQCVWLLASTVGYAAVIRGILGERFGWLLALAFPPVAWNIFVGQNGCFTAMLLGGTLHFLDKRPALAGICLGLLAYKPQFGLLFPLVLLVGGHWRTIGFAAVTMAITITASLAAFGTSSWHAFIAAMPKNNAAILDEGLAGFVKLQTLFASVRIIGGSMAMAWGAQALLVLALLGLVIYIWRKPVSRDMQLATLAAAVPLATPYLYTYDQVVLAVPIAFVLRNVLREKRFLPYEAHALVAVWVLLFSFALPFVHMQTGLLASALVMGVVLRRAFTPTTPNA